MNLNYLIPLARKGAIDIHPGGWRATLALLEALDLQAGNSVLEIGCGTGGTLVRLQHEFPLRIVGIDVLPEMLSAACKRLHYVGVSKGAYLAQSNAVALPFPERSFDRAFAESIIGFQDTHMIKEILAEIHRVLKPKG